MIGNLRKGCIHILLVLCCFSAQLAVAAELREEEVEALRVEISSMLASVEQGDIDALLDKTHPVLYDLGGSRESLARSMHEALEGIRAVKTRFVSSEMGRPTELYPAGDEELCFVPRVSIIESRGQRIRRRRMAIPRRFRSAPEPRVAVQVLSCAAARFAVAAERHRAAAGNTAVRKPGT
jgi:hypothetical protein